MRYALVYPEDDGLRAGMFVKLDDASGGYPYAVDDPHEAHTWPTREAAERYRASFSEFDVVVIKYKVERV